MPSELLVLIARHLVERSNQNVLDENIHYLDNLAYSTYGSRVLNKIPYMSPNHYLSSSLFAFRLVCKKWAAAGLDVFLECAKMEGYTQYTKLHLPPAGSMSITGLTDMLVRQPRISDLLTELVIHVTPDYLPPMLKYHTGRDASNRRQAFDLRLCNDAMRMYKEHNNETLLCGRHSPNLGLMDPLEQLIHTVHTIHSVQIQYEDFWSAHPSMTDAHGLLPLLYVRRQPPPFEAKTYDLLPRLWRALPESAWPTLKLINVGSDLLRSLHKLHDQSIVKMSAGITSLEICLSARDEVFKIPEQTLPASGRLSGTTTFLKGFRQSRELDAWV